MGPLGMPELLIIALIIISCSERVAYRRSPKGLAKASATSRPECAATILARSMIGSIATTTASFAMSQRARKSHARRFEFIYQPPLPPVFFRSAQLISPMKELVVPA